MNDLFLIAINLTRRCNLACDHCYMDAETRLSGGNEELKTHEVKHLLDEICTRSNETMVVLTGGEPLLRRDLEQLIEHGNKQGLSMVVGSNSIMLTEQRVQSLKAAGTMGIGISLDSLDPEKHDSFRGCPGSWEKTLEGIEYCRRHELPFQIHFSVTENNAEEVRPMIDFARGTGAHVMNVFFLVCTGRGESMSDITPARYEQVLAELIEAQETTSDLIIRARCAPHYKRIAYARDANSTLTRAQGYEGGGCLAGIHYCRITPEGAVTACPYIPDEEGSIRDQAFWEIWEGSSTFQQLRDPQLGGKCGQCEYRKLCGGCRARPLAMGGTLMDADPWCSHEPTGTPLIEPLSVQQRVKINWSEAAESRLNRVPPFLRKMVRKRAEDYVLQQGESLVTPAHLKTLASRRFGDSFPGNRPIPASDSPGSPESRTSGDRLPWTAEARAYLENLPGFLRDGVFQVACDVARSEGRLEVNIKLLQRLEEEDTAQRTLTWSPGAEQTLDHLMEDRSPAAAMFVRPGLETTAEAEARLRGSPQVSEQDVEKASGQGNTLVQWDPAALARVESAPDFVKAGIKKAAEFNAHREGLELITSEHLTRFRNRAMMRAVRRIRGFGMKELNFDAFDIARERVPRLKENAQAVTRFSEIRQYVSSRQSPDGGGLGIIDREMLDKMKAELKK
ncbi:MAG: radical SAM protein [Gammaproteobacteria bacterium]|nr:radical SAM protein [Gammaproteobacteria bacterium]